MVVYYPKATVAIMVRKQHSKTPNVFINKKKNEPSESNFIQRIASPLGRFHTFHTTSRETSEGSEKTKVKSVKRHKRNKSTTKGLDVSFIPPMELPKSDQIDTSLDSCIIENDSELSESMSQSENSTASYGGSTLYTPKRKNVFRRKNLNPLKEDTPRLSGPEKNIENARKAFFKGQIKASRKTVCV